MPSEMKDQCACVCVWGGRGGGSRVWPVLLEQIVECVHRPDLRLLNRLHSWQAALSPHTNRATHTYTCTHTHTNVERDKQILTKY